ncbi:hypothetical protein GW17_00044953 [Ensete ventricosum]|nr:hypothetical protein GW17_00044953 [Ensete ventricosum]
MVFAGDDTSWSMATPAAEVDMVGKDYVGISEVSSSSYPGSAGVGCGMEEEEEELELGLSLGTKKAVGGGGTPWAEYCRILTAEDLPSMGSRASPLSSSSSVSSSSSPTAGGERCSGREAKKTSNNPPRCAMFLSTVKRLRIMKTSDASGLGKFLQPTYVIDLSYATFIQGPWSYT